MRAKAATRLLKKAIFSDIISKRDVRKMNFDMDFLPDDYNDPYALDYSGMDYIFSANVSGCDFSEKTIRLLDTFRKEGSVVTFTFGDGKVLNTSDIHGVSEYLGNVRIEFQFVCENLMAEIDVFDIGDSEFEIILMLPHEELKKLSREKAIFDTAKKFFECLKPKYGVTGEQVFAQVADEISDDEFITYFEEIGYIGSCQYNMTAQMKKHAGKFAAYPLSYGEMYVGKDFEKELRRIEKKMK